MNLGSYPAGFTSVVCMFTTHDSTGAAVAPSSAFEAADVRCYKDGGSTERSSTAGWTMTSPFDSLTGLHCLILDLSDNTDAGFYAAGHVYTLVLWPDTETVDAVAPLKVIGQFTIGVGLHPATLGRTLVVDANGLADANAVKVGPTGSGTAQTARDIGASVLLSNGTGTGQVKLSSGYVAPNWGDVGNPTTTVGLSGTTIKDATDVETAITAVPAAVWAVVLDGTRTAIQLMRGITAAILGKSSGLGSGSPTYRNIADSKDVIAASSDSNGNRSSVTLDLT